MTTPAEGLVGWRWNGPQLFVYFPTFCGAGIQSGLELRQLSVIDMGIEPHCVPVVLQRVQGLENWVGRWEELRGLPAVP